MALALLASVITARALGAGGRGEYAVALAVAAIGVQLANVGIHTTASWLVARDRALVGPLLGNGFLLGLILGSVAAAVVLLVGFVVPRAIDLQPELLVLLAIAIPLGLVYLVLQNLFLGLGSIAPYNGIELGNRVVATGILAALAIAGGLTAAASVAGYVVGLAGAVLVATAMLARMTTVPVRPNLRLAREHAGYGLRAYAAAGFTYLVLRVDLVIVDLMLGHESAGQYSIAVGVADLVVLVPVVIATLLFPRLSAIENRAVQISTTMTALLWTIGLVSVIAAVTFILSETLVRALYGGAFVPSVPALLWLLPAMVLLSIHTILMHFFFAIGTPRVTIVAPLVGLVINVALNVALIPSYGIVGSAIASAIAYAVMLAVSGSSFVAHWRSVR